MFVCLHCLVSKQRQAAENQGGLNNVVMSSKNKSSQLSLKNNKLWRCDNVYIDKPVKTSKNLPGSWTKACRTVPL